jgi:hypothetical protein
VVSVGASAAAADTVQPSRPSAQVEIAALVRSLDLVIRSPPLFVGATVDRAAQKSGEGTPRHTGKRFHISKKYFAQGRPTAAKCGKLGYQVVNCGKRLHSERFPPEDLKAWPWTDKSIIYKMLAEFGRI